MIKRPLNAQFKEAVLSRRKFTTIRAKPWPLGTPIMLYHWAGAPYRSKHVDVAPIIVQGYWPIAITHNHDHTLAYDYGMEHPQPLYETEGFDSQEALDAWFRPLTPHGRSIIKILMRFRLATSRDL